MFEIKNLSKKYVNNDFYSVKNLSISIEDGEIFGFLGPNGSGKSTTIKCMVGILPYGKNDAKRTPLFSFLTKKNKRTDLEEEISTTEEQDVDNLEQTTAADKPAEKASAEEIETPAAEIGQEEFDEQLSSITIDGIELNESAKEYKNKIAYVSDNHAVFERLTGLEYVDHIANLYGTPMEERNEIIDKYSKIFKLEKAIHKPISTYSHGMKQKINVISALVHNPKVWVLDEPLLGLDPVSAYQLKIAMREHANAGNIVFFSSHMIDVVYAICDKVGIIVQGDLKAVYNVKDLKQNNTDLEKIFLEAIGERVED